MKMFESWSLCGKNPSLKGANETMIRVTIAAILLITTFACAKKPANDSSRVDNPKSGTMTSGPATTTNSSAEAAARDLAGTWIVNQGGDTWELVVSRTGPGAYSGSSTLLATDNPNGINGPPGSKGDDIVIVSDSPGTFRVRWAKAENFHKADFWEGSGTYDDNSFNFAGVYKGKRKS